MCFQIVLDLFSGPSGHRVEFEDVAIADDIEVIEFEELDVGASVALLSANAGDPDGEVGEFVL